MNIKNNFILVSFIISTVFVFTAAAPVASAVTTPAAGISISEFVELMITIGLVPADRVVAVRAMVVTLGKTVVPVTSAATILPYLQVLSPNGGENWDMDMDVPYNITWGSSSVIPVTVSLLPAKGAACNLTATPIASNNGNNSLAVKLKTANCYNQVTGTSTPLVANSYKVVVSYKTGTSTVIKDESNASFKINPVLIPSLKMSYPAGGESLIRGRDYVVKYKLTNASVDNTGLIYLKLIDTQGNIAFNSRKLVVAAGIYDLELPKSLTPGAYKVQLTLTTSKKVELESSSGLFWVSSAN